MLDAASGAADMESPEDAKARYNRFLPVHAAFVSGDFDGLAKLLGPSPRWFDQSLGPELLPDHPLSLTIQLSPVELIEALLIAGANPNYPEPPGTTPLFAAIGEQRPDRLEIFRLLLAYGADPDHRGVHAWTPLHHAVAWRNTAAIEILLASGANPNLHSSIGLRSTPLDAARLSNYAEGIALLGAVNLSGD
jgi:ankyrin repeat protein